MAHAHALKPSRVAFGADGVPITRLLESTSSISSDALRFAGAPFVVARVNDGFAR